MSRRTLPGRVYEVTADNVNGSGVVELVAPDSDLIVVPKSALISAHSGGNFESSLSMASGAAPFLHSHIPSNSSQEYTWPEGYELPKGSGVYITPLANDGAISFYYCLIDESAGVIKSAARTTTYNASLTTPKATRKPNIFGGQAEG
jgi:hypothetical protein